MEICRQPNLITTWFRNAFVWSVMRSNHSRLMCYADEMHIKRIRRRVRYSLGIFMICHIFVTWNYCCICNISELPIDVIECVRNLTVVCIDGYLVEKHISNTCSFEFQQFKYEIFKIFHLTLTPVNQFCMNLIRIYRTICRACRPFHRVNRVYSLQMKKIHTMRWWWVMIVILTISSSLFNLISIPVDFILIYLSVFLTL